MSEKEQGEFVVLGKAQTSDGKIGARVIPLSSFTAPDQIVGSTLFADKGYVIGGCYRAYLEMDENGRIKTMSTKSEYLRRLAGDWGAAQLVERDLIESDRRRKAEARMKKAARGLPEIDRLAELIAKAPHGHRYTMAQTLAGMIVERSYAIKAR
jgi:hypothetical protein